MTRQKSSRSRSQLWGLFALIFYAPLPLASDRVWALASLGLFAGVLLLWNIWRPQGRAPESIWAAVRIPLLLMGGWIALLLSQLLPLGGDAAGAYAGLSVSIDVYSTRMYLAKACILALIFWLTLTLVDSHSRIELLAKMIVFSGLFQAMLGVILMATGTTFELFFTPMVDVLAHGTFVYHNHLAGYLELALATGIGLMIAKLDGRGSVNWRQRLHSWLSLLFTEKVLLRVSLIIMVVGLVATRSRMGNTAFFASLLVTGALAVLFAKRAEHGINEVRARELMHVTILFISSLIVIDVVIIGGVVGIEKVVQRIQNTNVETQAKVISVPGVATPKVLTAEESIEQRSKAARSAVQIVRDFPVLGVGGGTFHLVFPHYQPAEIQAFYDHAHNDYVEVASETGLAGLFLLAVFVLHSLGRSVKLLAGSHDQLGRGIAFASVMGVISLLIHASVDFNFQNPTNAMIFLIVLSFPYLQNMARR